ncbi:MAG: S8 family serine peptidase, partial [Candidatus Eisenbacteria bacterium]
MPRSSDCGLPRFFIIFIAVAVLAAFGLPPSAGAQSHDRPATDRAALESLAGRLHQQALREQPELLRILNDASPAQQRLAADPDIQLIHIDRRDRPLYYRVENLIAAQSVGTDRVWPGGTGGTALTGSGLPAGALAVWDAGGVLVAHQEFGGRATQMDSPAATHYHSTHVAGTMIGAGVDPAAHGMAHQALLAAYDWNDAEYEMALAAADGMLISNHSYGFATGWTWSSSAQAWYWYGDVLVSPVEDHYFGLYSVYAAEYDQIAYDAPYYTIVKSAGNDRDDAGPGPGGGHYYWDPDEGWTWSTDTRNADGFDGGYDCLPTHGAAKNILTIGAVDDIPGGYADPGDVVMSGFSSWGPTDDGRIKPDLVANGIGLYSTTDSGTDQYRSLSGTSMSSPNLSGSLVLIAEHFSAVMGEVPLASTVKAILVQTCDEAGPSAGPDYQHGWGLLNTARAVELISAHPLDPRRIVEGVLADAETDRYYFHSDGLAPLRFTIAWTDPPGTPPFDALDPADPMLVNDLDLRVESLAGPGIHEPYVLDPAVPEAPAATGDNVLDNVEQIYVAAPAEGDYIVRITHKGSLAQPQAYALAASHPLSDHKVCWSGADFQTLQAAVDAAQSGEVIELCCDQPFSGLGNRDIDFQGKDLVVRSVCGNPLRCVIDCGGSAAEPHRAFLFQSGETAASRLEGLTLRNGHAGTAPGDEGGAVLCVNASSPELIECILAGNEAA